MGVHLASLESDLWTLMTTSPTGRTLIASFEGCVLTAYQDQRGIWSIGFGHTGAEVVEGLMWTQEQADTALADDLARRAEAPINSYLLPLNQNQFDALVSLVYNIGQGDFAISTVLRKLKQGDFPGAATAILMWCKVNGETDPGLLRRREAEQAVFLTPVLSS